MEISSCPCTVIPGSDITEEIQNLSVMEGGAFFHSKNINIQKIPMFACIMPENSVFTIFSLSYHGRKYYFYLSDNP